MKTTRSRLFLCLLITICLVVDVVMFVTRRRYDFGIESKAHSFRSYPVLQWLLYMPGKDGSYSQNYQDKWMLHFAALNGLEHSGFFLDIGAYHGERERHKYNCTFSAPALPRLNGMGVQGLGAHCTLLTLDPCRNLVLQHPVARGETELERILR